MERRPSLKNGHRASTLPRVGIVGTVGVPARYGGFETLTEQLAIHIAPDEAELVIYCQRSAYPEVVNVVDKKFAGHKRVFVPMRANGPASMLHDVLAMLHAAIIVQVDVLLVLGYSGAWAMPLLKFLRPRMSIITNIDGMEWRRDKFGAKTKRVLRLFESLAIRHSSRVIVDNAALVPILRSIYPDLNPLLIAYGGDHTLVTAGVMPVNIQDPFYLSIARIEPENNCHLILAAFEAADNSTLVFVGNWNSSKYGCDLKEKYSGNNKIHMLDPIYQQSVLAALRTRALAYVHGHSVGGTNPSLVEALFHTNRVLAFDCPFNRSTLDNHGCYFSNALQLKDILNGSHGNNIPAEKLQGLRQRYRWKAIAQNYMSTFLYGQKK